MLIFRYQLHLKNGTIFSKPDFPSNGTFQTTVVPVVVITFEIFDPQTLTSMYFNYEIVMFKNNYDGYGRCEILI